MKLPGVSEPSEDLYQELRDVSSVVKIAWYEAQACPEQAKQILDRHLEAIRRLSQVTEMHLRNTAERARQRESTLDRAIRSAEQRAGAALAGIAASTLEDGFDPNGYYVYCLWDADQETPLYVGKSTNILARLGSHMGDPGKRHKVRRITLIRCTTERRMGRTEERLIAHHQPPLNTRGIVDDREAA